MFHPYFIINRVSGCPDLNHEHDGWPEYWVIQMWHHVSSIIGLGWFRFGLLIVGNYVANWCLDLNPH